MPDKPDIANSVSLPVDSCAVRIEGLEVSPGGHTVLRNLSGCFPLGGRSIISGPNGVGKTTLIKAILGLVKPTRGKVTVLGNTVGSIAWRRGRHRVGYVNQESVHSDMPISAHEVVEIGTVHTKFKGSQRSELVKRAMDLTGCAGLDHAPFAALSGGEKQRISLARCFAQRPRLLLLDEPTSGLDPEAQGSLIELIEHLNEEEETTVIMVTHDRAHFERSGWDHFLLRGGSLTAANGGTIR